MQDTFNRQVSYLRLSITPACSMRCLYCRPGTLDTARGEALLTPDEIESLVRHLVQTQGLKKLRLTGGEPTARPDLLEIIRRVASIGGLRELVMTSNGLTMVRQARDLMGAGLQRVNISLDSLDAARFHRITGVDGLPRVLQGIDAAVAAGLHPVKINCVVVRGENDHELPDLLLFAAGKGLEICFIELMPMGPLASRWAERYVTGQEMRATLSSVVSRWEPLVRDGSPARRQRAHLRDGRTAQVGFITAMSDHFCDDCNRIRIGSDGSFYPCLMDRPSGTVLHALRPRLDAVELNRVLEQGLRGKSPIHPAEGHVVMVQIGG